MSNSNWKTENLKRLIDKKEVYQFPTNMDENKCTTGHLYFCGNKNCFCMLNSSKVPGRYYWYKTGEEYNDQLELFDVIR